MVFYEVISKQNYTHTCRAFALDNKKLGQTESSTHNLHISVDIYKEKFLSFGCSQRLYSAGYNISYPV